jgi:hypothetical protein
VSPDKRQPSEDPAKAGLTPWTIAGALTAGAAVWVIVELIQRVF